MTRFVHLFLVLEKFAKCSILFEQMHPKLQQAIRKRTYVAELSIYSKSQKPDFLFIPDNGYHVWPLPFKT